MVVVVCFGVDVVVVATAGAGACVTTPETVAALRLWAEACVLTVDWKVPELAWVVSDWAAAVVAAVTVIASVVSVAVVDATVTNTCDLNTDSAFWIMTAYLSMSAADTEPLETTNEKAALGAVGSMYSHFSPVEVTVRV